MVYTVTSVTIICQKQKHDFVTATIYVSTSTEIFKVPKKNKTNIPCKNVTVHPDLKTPLNRHNNGVYRFLECE